MNSFIIPILWSRLEIASIIRKSFQNDSFPSPVKFLFELMYDFLDNTPVMFYVQHKGCEKAKKVVEFVAK